MRSTVSDEARQSEDHAYTGTRSMTALSHERRFRDVRGTSAYHPRLAVIADVRDWPGRAISGISWRLQETEHLDNFGIARGMLRNFDTVDFSIWWGWLARTGSTGPSVLPEKLTSSLFEHTLGSGTVRRHEHDIGNGGNAERGLRAAARNGARV